MRLIDQQDRRILGIGLVLLLAGLVVLVALAAVLGLALRVFLIVAGLGG